MHVEIRKRKKSKLYYLAHSFRDGPKVRKVRRYLGADLSQEKVSELRRGAEKAIREQIALYRKIRDPLHTVLSPREEEIVKYLVAKGPVMRKQLSKQDWTRFTERFTYDTNAIEGSTVTASEVGAILEDDRWPQNKPKEEISETYGVAGAVAFIRKTRDHLSLSLIRELHRMVFKNSKVFAGRFRGKGIEVVVANQLGTVLHRGAPQREITGLLKELVTWYENNRKRYHPIVLAAVVHNQFENIHPFQDGNGRVGRLLLNNILLKHGLPPLNIELKNRRKYYAALQAYEQEGNLRQTIELMLKEYRALGKILKRR